MCAMWAPSRTAVLTCGVMLRASGNFSRAASCAFRVSTCVHHQSKTGDDTCGKPASNSPAKTKTPIGKLDELPGGRHPHQEKEPLAEFPDGVNPATGEVGGPRGPEPTRYGDWERKGRVSDF